MNYFLSFLLLYIFLITNVYKNIVNTVSKTVIAVLLIREIGIVSNQRKHMNTTKTANNTQGTRNTRNPLIFSLDIFIFISLITLRISGQQSA